MASFRFVRRSALALTLASTTWLCAPAEAAHRARIGADLERTLAAGSQSIDVIVHGNRTEVDGLARRYNLRVRRYLKTGAVLDVNAGQLDALSQDVSVDHLSADVAVRSSSLVTESIGADQVSAGVANVRPLSGAGIGIALIDSGIDRRHAALANRVVYTKDFTGGDGSDAYGHGTHVGALIAGGAGTGADIADYRGVAPAAQLINLRVLNAQGVRGGRATSSTPLTGPSSTAPRSTSASSTCRSAHRWCSRTRTTRCAKPWSARSRRGWWWWRRPAITA